MLALLLAIASGALLRYGQRVYPRLQHSDVYQDDFVHDDTEHPDEAVKLNIKESENRLKEAKAAFKTVEAKLAAAKKDYDKYGELVEAKDGEIAHAEEQQAHFNKSMTSLSQYKAKLEEATANLTAAKDALNTSNVAAKDAAEAVADARQDFHKKNLLEVEAKENVTDMEDALEEWEAKLEESKKANISLAEWQAKLNASAEDDHVFQSKAETTKEAYDAIRADYKKAETRFSEAQKLFEVDKETYEEHVGGSYPPAEPEEDKSLWDHVRDFFSR